MVSLVFVIKCSLYSKTLLDFMIKCGLKQFSTVSKIKHKKSKNSLVTHRTKVRTVFPQLEMFLDNFVVYLLTV